MGPHLDPNCLQKISTVFKSHHWWTQSYISNTLSCRLDVKLETFFPAIGKGLGNLKKLKNLRIDCNQLLKIEIPELSPCVQLTVLDISYNMLDSLAVSHSNHVSCF